VIRGRWYISARAVREYAALVHRSAATDDDFDARAQELEKLVAGAHYVSTQRNGLERWRLGRPHRFQLLVSTAPRPEGPLPQLISVRPEFQR
jgi:hypothetical protein